MANEQRVVELVIDASGVEAGARRAEAAYEHLGDRASAAAEKAKASFQVQSQVLSANLPTAIDRAGAAYDRLRAKTDPVLAAQLKLEGEMTRSLGVINRAILLGVTTEERANADITKLRQQQIAELDAVRAAYERTSDVQVKAANQNQRGLSEGNRAFIGRDIAFQAQDVVTTAIGGMSPKTIALQQGTQIAGAISGLTLRETGSALAGAVSNLLNPISLVSIAFTGLAAAGIQYFDKSRAGAKTLDDALKANNENLQILKTTYRELNSEISGNLGGNSAPNANLRANDIVQQAVARQVGNKYLAQIGGQGGLLSYFGARSTPITRLQNLTGSQQPFQQPINDLLAGVRSGTTDFEKFQDQVEKTYQTLAKTSDGNNAAQTNANQWRAAADAVLGMADSALKVDTSIKVLGTDGKETSQSLRPFQDAINRLKLGMAENHPDFVQFTTDVEKIGQSTGLQQVADQVIVLAKELLNLNLRMQETEVLQNKLFNDRGPNGRLLSQGATNAADDNQLGLYQSQQRVQLERNRQAFNSQLVGITARSPIERGAAAREAASAEYNNDESPVQRRQRIDNAGELARAQAQNSLDEAAKERKRSLDQSIASQQLELTTIGKTGGEVAALRMQYQLTSQVEAEAAKNNVSVNQQELDLIKQKSAEYGQLADQISRANLRNDLQFERDQLYRNPVDQQIASRQRSAGMTVDLNSSDAQFMRQTAQIDDVRTSVKGFFTDFEQQLVSNGGKTGQALGTAIKDAALNALQKIGDKALDKLTNFVTDIFTGGKQSSGAAGGGIAGAGVNAVASLLGGAANDNKSGAAALTSNAGVQGQIWNFFAQKGLQPHQIAGIMGNIGAESSFNPNAVGDNGTAFGLFQNHADRGGGSGLLASGVQGQLDHAWNELQGPENKAFQALLASKDAPGAAAAFAGFERPRGFSWDNPQGADNFAGRLNGAESALAKFGSTTSAATQGVGQLGTGLGQLGQSLASSAFPAAPQAGGGGGIGGFLTSLFAPSSSSILAGSAQARAALASGSAGLFDRGGFTGVGGVNDPAGIVHRGEVVWSQRDVARAGGVAAVEGMRLGYRGYASGGPVAVPPIRPGPANSNGNPGGGNMKVDVGVSVDNNGNLQAYVKNTSRDQATQVSQQGIADYGEAQRRGGFGAVQSKWVSQRS